MDRYPVTDKEKNCRYEKQKQDYLREEYKRELLNEKEKVDTAISEHKPEV